MSEENLEKKELEVTPGMEKALKAGWCKEEDWRGEPDEWVDYQQFNVKGELMGRINEQSGIISHLTNKVSDRDKAITDLNSLYDKISEREYKKAMTELKAQKTELLEEQNFEGVVEVDEQIAELKDNKPEPAQGAQTQQQQDEGVPQEIVDWLGKPEQSWYHTNPTLRGMSEGIASVIQAENPNISVAELIKAVDKGMRKEVPQYFPENADVDTGGEFNSNSSQRKGGGKLPGWNSLTDEQKAVATRLERTGALTKKEYIESLVELGELE